MQTSLIDLARYPLDDSGGARALVRESQTQLRKEHACVLPGFLTPEGVRLALENVHRASPSAHQVDHYFDYDDTGVDSKQERPGELGSDDPRNFRSLTRIRFIARDLLPVDDPLHRLHIWAPMVRFVAAVMERPRVWPSSCPLSGSVRTVAGAGELQDWHFDSNDFIVTVVLDVPRDGGAFEYVPGLRRPDGLDDLAGVSAALAGVHPDLRQLHQSPGTLTLFKGRYNFHRAAPVVGLGERVIAVLSYENAAAHASSPEWLRLFYGRTVGEPPYGDRGPAV